MISRRGTACFSGRPGSRLGVVGQRLAAKADTNPDTLKTVDSDGKCAARTYPSSSSARSARSVSSAHASSATHGATWARPRRVCAPRSRVGGQLQPHESRARRCRPRDEAHRPESQVCVGGRRRPGGGVGMVSRSSRSDSAPTARVGVALRALWPRGVASSCQTDVSVEHCAHWPYAR